MRFHTWSLLVLLLAGCAAPAVSGPQPGATPAAPAASIVAATPGNSPAGAATAAPSMPAPVYSAATPTVLGTAAPANTAAPAIVVPTSVAATAAPSSVPAKSAVALTTSELKFRLIEQYGIFYCPAGSPPTANDEMDQALASFASIQNDAEVYRAILAHDQLSSATSFSPQQKLLIYRDYRKLGLVTLTQAGDAYNFRLRTMERLQGVLLTGSITPQGISSVSDRQQVVNRCTT